jgi:hypothetical protein
MFANKHVGNDKTLKIRAVHEHRYLFVGSDGSAVTTSKRTETYEASWAEFTLQANLPSVSEKTIHPVSPVCGAPPSYAGKELPIRSASGNCISYIAPILSRSSKARMALGGRDAFLLMFCDQSAASDAVVAIQELIKLNSGQAAKPSKSKPLGSQSKPASTGFLAN